MENDLNNNKDYYVTSSAVNENSNPLIISQNADNSPSSKDLPRLKLIRTFSILAICFSPTMYFSIFGVIFSILSFVFIKISSNQYNNNKGKYTEKSYKKIRKFKTIVIIAIIISICGFIANSINTYNDLYSNLEMINTEIPDFINDINHY